MKAVCQGLLLLTSAFLLGGCIVDPPKRVIPTYPTLPAKKVPDYLSDTILQYTDLGGTDPYPVSGYGLVANLKGTGGSRAPTAVREFMIKEMARHGIGSVGSDSPEKILGNKSFAIVRVEGFIPPGARAGLNTDPSQQWFTWFDVRVTAMPESDTTSLAHGDLYLSELKINGANPMEPGSGHVEVKAQAEGPVFINPAYALDDSDNSVAARSSRRSGVVLGGARPIDNRPLVLRLRAPSRSLARSIERRINEQFQDVMDEDLPVKANGPYLADAQDEGQILVFVPHAYVSDWEHFAGVLRHLYMRGGSPEFAAIKAQQLAVAAVTKDAPLKDISYAWEGLGKPALHALLPLMTGTAPDVQYAAARAGAFLGDPGAVALLASLARTPGNPFRLNAVQTLGELTPSSVVDAMLRQLLDSDQAMVRIEAYKVLARHKDSAVYTRVIKCGEREKFALDIVHGRGTPMIYASRQGIPRLAVFGERTALDLPLMYVTLQDHLSISSNPEGEGVTIFYRGRELKKPVKVISSPDIAEIAARLGGDGRSGNTGLDFSYADIVAVLQSLIDGKKVSGMCGNERQLASFVLQDLPKVEEMIDSAPLIKESGRPQADHPTTGHPRTDPGGQLGTETTPSPAAEQPAATVGSGISGSNAADIK